MSRAEPNSRRSIRISVHKSALCSEVQPHWKGPVPGWNRVGSRNLVYVEP